MTDADAARPTSRGHTVLQVPVPPLESFVRARNAHYDADFVSTDPAFVHAHITALGPFLPPEQLTDAIVADIGRIAAAAGQFDFTLDEIEVFPNGIIHLVPQPETPFGALTKALAARFPECPPYGGQFGDVRPHLTLDAESGSQTTRGQSAASGEKVGVVGEAEEITVESTRALLGSLIPALCRAERLDLAWWSAGDCRTLRSWPLGGCRADRS